MKTNSNIEISDISNVKNSTNSKFYDDVQHYSRVEQTIGDPENIESANCTKCSTLVHIMQTNIFYLEMSLWYLMNCMKVQTCQSL